MLLFLLLLLKLGCSSETVGNYVGPKPCAQCPLIYLIIIIIIFYFFFGPTWVNWLGILHTDVEHDGEPSLVF